MRRITPVALAVTLLAATAAIASTTRSFFDRSYNFDSVRSFIFQEQERVSADSLANNSIWADLIRGSLQANLRAHGFEEKEAGGADVILSFSVELAERYDVRIIDYGYPYFWGPLGRDWAWGRTGFSDIWTIPYTESTLIVDIVDARTNRLVWRGSNVDTLDLDDVDEELPDAAHDVLERFYEDVHLGDEDDR